MPRRKRLSTSQRLNGGERLEERTLYAVVPLSGGTSDYPFDAATAEELGTSIGPADGRGSGLYDLQPTVLYRPELPRPFQMWWLGQAPSPPTGTPADRIYYSDSIDGRTFSTPQAVLAPQLGATGQDEADDHLLGSPTVLHLNGKYYMFYEGYGQWATPVQRLFNFGRGDTWTTNGSPERYLDPVSPEPADIYGRDRLLGFAPRYQKAGTHPVYGGEVRYPTGKYDRYLSLTPITAGADPSGAVHTPLYDNLPVVYLYNEAAPGRVALRQYFDSAHANTFVTNDISTETVVNPLPGRDFELGYVAASLDAPDMAYSVQNRIMLATSTDGIHWNRFQGSAELGHAVAVPHNAHATRMDDACNTAIGISSYDVHRPYGSGFPAALVRDDTLELYFTDDSQKLVTECFGGPTPQWRITLPVDQIENPAAYVAADSRVNGTREPAFYGEDIKWSPELNRYFVLGFTAPTASAAAAPNLVWSRESFSQSDRQYELMAENGQLRGYFSEQLPTGATRGGAAGGIASNGRGHVLSTIGGNSGYETFHLYYSAAERVADWGNIATLHHVMDIDHTLVFGYFGPPDRFVSAHNPPIVNEGNTGAAVRLVLNAASPFPVTVNYRTKDESAIAGVDYTATSGAIVFQPGETVKDISVDIHDDFLVEHEETFTVEITSVINATLTSSSGLVTIRDQDVPRVVISDAEVVETAPGEVTDLVFTVTLDTPHPYEQVAVAFRTSAGSALPTLDYLESQGTILFPNNAQTATLVVPVKGDLIAEGMEDLFVELFNVSHAIVADGTAIGKIINLTPIPGDANIDGRVDAVDFEHWFSHLFRANTSWRRGDFDGNGSTDAVDFNIWLNNRFQSDLAKSAPVRRIPRAPSVAASVERTEGERQRDVPAIGAPYDAVKHRSTLMSQIARRNQVSGYGRSRSNETAFAAHVDVIMADHGDVANR